MLVIKIFSERKKVFREGKKCEKIRAKSHDERRITQNSGICSPGKDEEMYYEDDPDIIHVDNSSDLSLSISLSDLEITALHIDGQSIDVDAPPDIIDEADDDDDDDDDDIIDDDDVLPHDLADFDDEDLVNVDDGDGMSTDLARGHDRDGGDDDHPPLHQLADGCRGKDTQKPNLGGRKAGRMHTRKETRNLSIPTERKATVLRKIGAQFDLKPHMQSELLPEIRKGIDQHRGKIYMDNKSSLKKDYWKIGMRRSGFGLISRTWPDAELHESREEMQRLYALGEYTYDQIIVMVRKGMQRGHIPSVGRGLVGRGKDVLDVLVPRWNHTFDVNELKRNNKQIDMIKKIMSSDDRMS
nr:hypothetical protein [Tanacetum cinerariifolium]